MKAIDYLEFTCPKEKLENPTVEISETPFYVRFLNKRKHKLRK